MRRSVIFALVLSLALVAWLTHPYLLAPAAEPTQVAVINEDNRRPPTAVRTRLSQSQEIDTTVISHGKTAPARSVELRAETEGRVVHLPIERGSSVARDQILVELDPREKQQMLNQAKASLEQRRIEYEAARQLGSKGYQAQTVVAKALADLELSKAMLQQEIIVLEHTRIKAPFAGILQSRPVEIGDFLKIGEHAATILEIDPLIIEADLPEATGARIKIGMKGSAKLSSGELVEGRLRYVSREASSATRTFRVELEISNPNRYLPAGVSATLELNLERIQAHKLSSSLLSLDDEGRIGVKLVDQNDRVRFAEARIVKSAHDTVWLAGLPDQVEVITVGQGFVRDGQQVVAKRETGADQSVHSTDYPKQQDS